MSDHYSFIESDSYKSENVLDAAVLVEDGVVWDQEEVQISLSYSNDEGETLTEQNEDNYLTANESGNDTHYFSVLENTNEANLNELSEIAIAYNEIDNSEIAEDQPTVRSICTIGGQPELYRIEGSDDLYAYEITCDQDGNVQKLRYKLRLNEHGQYESVMDSIEVVPFDSELENLSSQEHLEDENSLENVGIVVKQEIAQEQLQEEAILPDLPHTTEESGDELHVSEEDDLSNEPLNTIEDTKAGILDHNLLPIHKMEALDETNTTTDETLVENEISHEILSATSNDLVACTHNGDISTSIASITDETDNLSQFCAISNPDSGDDHESVQEAVHKQPNYEQILMIENQTCEEEESHDEISSSDVKHVNRQFISELDENSQDSIQSTNSEDEEHHINNAEYFEDPNETESDADDYQIVEGVHVTADTESHEETSHVIETFLQKESVQPQILKIQQQVPVLQSTIQEDKLKEMVNNNFNKVNKGFTYYVVKHPEKENVATITEQSLANKLIKANPRSILKSSYMYYEQKKEKEKPVVQKIEKRILKSKEAMQARVLHNFIAKTTIVHAPVRQQRLPRKQTIKPVERADEEIIVQEVVVSSNGFIETTEDGVVKSKVPLKPTEIVQLSDSDDDYDPKREHKKKKKHKKRKSKVPEIVISDSEEEISDENVVRIDLSADSEEDNEKDKTQQPEEDSAGSKKLRRSLRKSSVAEQDSTPNSSQNATPNSSQNGSTESNESNTKKRRGRPPKRRNSSSNDNSISTDTSSSSLKKQRRNTKDSLESNESNENKPEEQPSAAAEPDIHDIKTKWKCSKCPKTFPSQGSLKSHMQYHTFHEPSTRIAKQIVNKQEGNTLFKKPEVTVLKNKYECSHCKETFKNNILLSRHLKAHESSSKSLECSICKKIFADGAQLFNHRRTHVKEQMFKTTTLPKHSPPKTSKRSPKQHKQFKCDYCAKIFTSLSLLNSHLRTHKRFICSTCSANFISKLALEEHVRFKCVKQAKSKLPVKRLSLKTRKSFLTPPSRISKRISLRKSVAKGNVSISKSASSSSDKEKKEVSASLHCDSCQMKFATHKALYSHKVVKHGLDTPDKNAIMASSKRKTLHKESGIHSSVPAGERLRSAYASIRTKLDM